VDDSSTDQTPEIIKEYAERDHRIISVRNETNLHLPGALNVGFRHSTGHLLSWTSHDNLYEPDAIEALVRHLSSTPDAGLICSAFRHIDERGRVDPRIVYLPPPCLLPFVNSVGPCFLYRREVYEAVGDYNEKAEYHEDYEYWLRVSKQFRLKRLHIPLYYYRRNPESMTAKMKQHPEIVGPLKIQQPR
jgi:GT2 family glycosyltransferase